MRTTNGQLLIDFWTDNWSVYREDMIDQSWEIYTLLNKSSRLDLEEQVKWEKGLSLFITLFSGKARNNLFCDEMADLRWYLEDHHDFEQIQEKIDAGTLEYTELNSDKSFVFPLLNILQKSTNDAVEAEIQWSIAKNFNYTEKSNFLKKFSAHVKTYEQENEEYGFDEFKGADLDTQQNILDRFFEDQTDPNYFNEEFESMYQILVALQSNAIVKDYVDQYRNIWNVYRESFKRWEQIEKDLQEAITSGDEELIQDLKTDKYYIDQQIAKNLENFNKFVRRGSL